MNHEFEQYSSVGGLICNIREECYISTYGVMGGDTVRGLRSFTNRAADDDTGILMCRSVRLFFIEYHSTHLTIGERSV